MATKWLHICLQSEDGSPFTKKTRFIDILSVKVLFGACHFNNLDAATNKGKLHELARWEHQPTHPFAF